MDNLPPRPLDTRDYCTLFTMRSTSEQEADRDLQQIKQANQQLYFNQDSFPLRHDDDGVLPSWYPLLLKYAQGNILSQLSMNLSFFRKHPSQVSWATVQVCDMDASQILEDVLTTICRYHGLTVQPVSEGPEIFLQNSALFGDCKGFRYALALVMLLVSFFMESRRPRPQSHSVYKTLLVSE